MRRLELILRQGSPRTRTAAWLRPLAAMLLLTPLALALQAGPPMATAVSPALPPLAQLLPRLSLCSSPDALANVHMHAVETWMNRHGNLLKRGDFETDRIYYYRGVEVEETQSTDGQPLSAKDQSRQEQDTRTLRAQIDQAWRGPRDTGRLVNINDEIWSLPQIVSLYQWTESPGPKFQGISTVLLSFRPKPDLHAGSRVQHVLLSMQGDLEVDPRTGQILAGQFTSTGPVKFGMGLMANFSHIHGSFSMQPAGTAWVFQTIRVDVDGRKLWTKMHGVEIMNYSVDPLVAAHDTAPGKRGDGASQE